MRFSASRERSLFGWTRRPRITLEIYSPRHRGWYEVPGVLADTGADLSLLPRSLGRVLLGRVRSRTRIRLGGAAPGARVTGYLHTLRVRVGGRSFRTPVVVASIDDVPAIFGRAHGLDHFDARFGHGRHVDLR